MTESADALSDRLFSAAVASFDLAGVYLGDRLGWYASLATDGPASADELAARTRTDARYAREWLEQQAVGGILEVDDDGRFSLPQAHAEVLVNPVSLSLMAPLSRMVAAAFGRLPALAEAYRTGHGIGWEAYGTDMREGQAAFNRPAFTHLLGTAWLPAIADLHAKLQADPAARVADIACGEGWSTIAMARAYPRARFVGIDLDGPSVEAARRHAAASGLDGQVEFHHADAAALDGPFDAAIIIEAVHDMSNPVPVLRTVRDGLAPGGSLIVVDERVPESFAPPGMTSSASCTDGASRPASPMGARGSRRWRPGPSCGRTRVAPMSSRGHQAGGLVDPDLFVDQHSTVHLIAETATQGPDGLGLGITCHSALGQVLLPSAGPLELSDGNAVQGGVELTVATTAEPVADVVAGPDRQRRRAVVTREGGPMPEASHAGGLADELGRGERSAAGELEQAGREARGQGGDLALETVDALRGRADVAHQLAGQPRHRPRYLGEPPLEVVEHHAAVQAAGGRLRARHQLVKVPAQAVLGSGALADEVLAVVDQQAQLALGTVEHGDRQIRLAQRGPRHGGGVDRIALARLACRAAGTGHQLGRNPHHRLAGAQQVGLQASAQVAAVLERPASGVEAGRPAHQLEVPGRRGGHRALRQALSGGIDRHRGVAVLVRVDANRHHVHVVLLIRGWHGPVGGHA
jgi:SAM-dependent methyltransferase/antitoxin (DNA-binding transcriptional repressor) of toxin-antitoxin stability system